MHPRGPIGSARQPYPSVASCKIHGNMYEVLYTEAGRGGRWGWGAHN